MYVKPSRKQVRGVYVPENYHGTAFDEQEQSPPPEHASTPAAMPEDQSREVSALPMSTPEASKRESTGISSLFSGLGNLRSDDILLLALILLLARSDKDGHSGTEILPMLAILLFIGP